MTETASPCVIAEYRYFVAGDNRPQVFHPPVDSWWSTSQPATSRKRCRSSGLECINHRSQCPSAFWHKTTGKYTICPEVSVLKGRPRSSRLPCQSALPVRSLKYPCSLPGIKALPLFCG